jgi:hypothetical protein
LLSRAKTADTPFIHWPTVASRMNRRCSQPTSPSSFPNIGAIDKGREARTPPHPPHLVIAGTGSGKTNRLTQRVGFEAKSGSRVVLCFAPIS